MGPLSISICRSILFASWISAIASGLSLGWEGWAEMVYLCAQGLSSCRLAINSMDKDPGGVLLRQGG